MAANVGQPNARAQFLALGMPLNNAHTAVGDIVDHARLTRRHLGLTLGAPIHLPVPMSPAIPRVIIDALRAVFRQMLAAARHPLHGREARTSAYFQAMLYAVTTAARRGQPRRNLVVDHGHPVQVFGQGIDIGGRCEFVITRNGRPFCVVELKRWVPGNGLFNRGRDQAILYAAAIGHATNRPMLAIVTDLSRWQFFRVSDMTYHQSDVFDMDISPRGTPLIASVRGILRRMLRFLTATTMGIIMSVARD